MIPEDRESGTPSSFRSHPFFAWLYDPMTEMAEKGFLLKLRREILMKATGRVLEIGAGTGRNFPLYQAATEVTATEPDPAMAKRAREKAEKAPVTVRVVVAEAEALPFAPGSFDTVVSTLVLCTVTDPAAALGEIRRVLVPGGRLLLMEHVQSEGGGWRTVQSLLNPLWGVVAAGCHLDRRTLQTVTGAGFDTVSRRDEGGGLFPAFVGEFRAP